MSKKKANKIIYKHLLKITICLLIITIVLPMYLNAFARELKVYFIDVGQGDSTLIIGEKNTNILIDGGGSLEYDIGKNILLPYLLDRKITSLDYVIISHFDNDHVGGLLTIIEELKVKNVIIAKQPEDSENYKKFKKIIQNKKIQINVVGADDSVCPRKIYIEKNLYFDVIWPDKQKMISENVLNNNSLVLKLNYKNFSMLFTGDIEETAEKQILKEYKDNLELLRSTILKVAHHGSKTSSNEKIVEAIKPQIALIGVGENNKFDHPNDEVLKRLENMRNKNL